MYRFAKRCYFYFCVNFLKISSTCFQFQRDTQKCGAGAFQISELLNFVFLCLLHSSVYSTEQFLVSFWWVPQQMLPNSIEVWSCTSVLVTQTRPNCEQKCNKKQLVFLLNCGFCVEKKFYRNKV